MKKFNDFLILSEEDARARHDDLGAKVQYVAVETYPGCVSITGFCMDKLHPFTGETIILTAEQARMLIRDFMSLKDDPTVR